MARLHVSNHFPNRDPLLLKVSSPISLEVLIAPPHSLTLFPELLSTSNFASMIVILLSPDDDPCTLSVRKQSVYLVFRRSKSMSQGRRPLISLQLFLFTSLQFLVDSSSPARSRLARGARCFPCGLLSCSPSHPQFSFFGCPS